MPAKAYGSAPMKGGTSLSPQSLGFYWLGFVCVGFDRVPMGASLNVGGVWTWICLDVKPPANRLNIDSN